MKVDEIQLTNYTLKVEDLALPKPAAFLLDQLALQVKGVSTVASEPASANPMLIRATIMGSSAKINAAKPIDALLRRRRLRETAMTRSRHATTFHSAHDQNRVPSPIELRTSPSGYALTGINRWIATM